MIFEFDFVDLIPSQIAQYTYSRNGVSEIFTKLAGLTHPSVGLTSLNRANYPRFIRIINFQFHSLYVAVWTYTVNCLFCYSVFTKLLVHVEDNGLLQNKRFCVPSTGDPSTLVFISWTDNSMPSNLTQVQLLKKS